MRRNLGLIKGFPKKLVLLNDEERAPSVMKEFKLLIQDFDHIKGLGDIITKKCQEVLDRHVANKTSVEQQRLMAMSKDWRPSKEQAAVNERRFTQILQTFSVEEIIGFQKNNKATMAQNRYRRPLSSMMSAIESGVLTERAKFKTVSTDIPLPKRAKLGSGYFESSVEKQSLPSHELANDTQKTQHYSPKSENNNVYMAAKRGTHFRPLTVEAASYSVKPGVGRCSCCRYPALQRLYEVQSDGCV